MCIVPSVAVSPLFAEDIAMSLTFRDFRDHDFCEIIILIFAMILIARCVQHIHYQISRGPTSQKKPQQLRESEIRIKRPKLDGMQKSAEIDRYVVEIRVVV